MPKKDINKINNKQNRVAKHDALINAMHSNIELDAIDIKPKEQKEQENKTKQQTPKDKRGLSAKSAMLHTYKEDVKDLVKKRKISMVRALAMQSDKKTQVDGDELVTISSGDKPASSNTIFFIISSILMFILGTVAIFIAYNAHQKQLNINSGVIAPIDKSLIFVEYRAKINITDRRSKDILRDLQELRDQTNTTLGSITKILPQDSGKTITQQELIRRLGLSLPEQFIRLMDRGDNYMIGIHIADRNTPFILLTTTSYEHAFASMLEWEKIAERELQPFFNISNNNPAKQEAENIVIKNLNARVIRDDNNQIRFLYSFLDDKTLLITNNIYTLTEIAQRYKVRNASFINK